MNLRDLQYIVAVADLKSFSKAADQCCVSQPTLSGQIKKLEESLGVTLFERTNKRVMLTEVGEEIITSARRMLREMEHITETAKHAHDPFSGKFRLGAFPTLASYVFPCMVPRVKEALPNLRLILVEEKTDQLIDKLHNGVIDAALLALPIHDDYLVSEPLFDDEFRLAMPPDHPLATRSEVSQAMLKGNKLLLLEEGHCLRDQALDVCAVHNIGEEEDFRATSLETLRQMVKAGTGITLMPTIAIGDEESGIQYIPFSAPAPKRTIGLVWRKTTSRAAVMEKLCGLVPRVGLELTTY